MLLIFSCEQDGTVDWFEKTYLAKSDLTWVRFNTEIFPERVSLSITPTNFLWSDGSTSFGPQEVRSVWFRRPAASEFKTRMRQVEKEYARNESEKALIAMRGLLSSAIWVNWPENNLAASQKIHQLRAAQDAGFFCPDTLVSNDPASILSFAEKHGGRLLVKPLHRGTITKSGKVRVFYSTLLTWKDLSLDQRSLKVCPLIYQELVPKAFELRVTVVNGVCFAARLDSQEDPSTMVDWRRNPYKMRQTAFELPQEIAERCLGMTQASGLLFTAFDLIVTPQGQYVFLEHNPNGQFAWLESLTGMPIGAALLDCFRPPSARY